MDLSFMDRLIEKVNSSQSLNLFNNPAVSFSNTKDNLKVYNSIESNNNGNDQIIEFLSAKKKGYATVGFKIICI